MSDHPNQKVPQRILILSANMGEGHNATGRALATAATRLWPQATIYWRDALEIMGRGVGPLFRRIYIANVEQTPWLYQFFYDLVWRYPWFARLSKQCVGAWCGRRLAAEVDRITPDLILSTYPLGTAGLDWLRIHRGLTAPIGAWVSDFAPHPFWVYQNIDLNLVMHEVAVSSARASVSNAAIEVSALTVAETFKPGDRKVARAELDLSPDALVSLVTCGSLGFGSVEDTIGELLDGVPSGQVVVVCGRNESLHAKIVSIFKGDPRVRVLGWVDYMAKLMVAADVVVTNAGGATSLEAIACGRPVLMHHPIAAHGKANAELMAKAGLAVVCNRDGELAKALRDQSTLRAMEQSALAQANSRTVEQGLLSLVTKQPQRGSRKLSPQDALFVYVDSQEVPQHSGAVLELNSSPEGKLPNIRDIADLLASVPGIKGKIDRGSWIRRPRWFLANPIDFIDLVDSSEKSLSEVLDPFFAAPLPKGALGSALLVINRQEKTGAILIKLHHSLGDGIAMLRALLSGTGGKGKAWSGSWQHHLSHRWPGRFRVRGLIKLARVGSISRGNDFDGGRRIELVKLPGAEVRNAARALGVTVTELLLAMFAHSYQGTQKDTLRVMVPWSLRGTATLRSAGNATGAIPIDLPIGPCAPLRRLRLIRAAVQAGISSGTPETANAIVQLMGLFPPGIHSFIAKHVYQSRWFSAIATILPGPRSTITLAGSEIEAAYPVLPLAKGVPIAFGAMTWGQSITVGLTSAGHMINHVGKIAQNMSIALTEFTEHLND